MESGTQTIDIFSLNNPYMIKGTKFAYLTDRLRRMKTALDGVTPYSIGDKVSVRSDGIKDKIKIDIKSNRTVVEFDANIVVSNVIKKTYVSTYLNIEELNLFLIDKGFLSYATVFGANIKKDDVRFSNFITKNEIDVAYLTSSENHFVYNKGMKYIYDPDLDQDKVVLSEDEFDKRFLMSKKPESKITVSSDQIDSIEATRMVAKDISASTAYQYDGLDASTLGYIANHTISVASLVQTESLKMETRLDGGGITNLESLQYFRMSYADKNFPELIEATSKSPMSDSNLTETEVGDYVVLGEDVIDMMEQKSDEIIGEKISSIDEFSSLIEGVCPVSNNYLPLDFDTGTPIYGGTNIGNGASLVNVVSFMDYISPISNKSMAIHNIASLYGKEDKLGIVLDYHAQLTGKRLDIALLDAGTLTDTLRLAICNLTHLNSTNIPKKPEEITIEIKRQHYFIPLELSGLLDFKIPLVYPHIIVPRYIDIPNINLFIPMSAVFVNISKSIKYPNISAQAYIPIPQIPFIPLQQQFGGGHVDVLRGVQSLFVPEPMPMNPPESIHLIISDQFSNYLIFFYYDSDLKERYVVESKRQFNMLEVFIIINKLKTIFTKEYYHLKGCSEEMVSRDYYIMYIVSKAIEKAYQESNMRFNVNLNFMSEKQDANDNNEQAPASNANRDLCDYGISVASKAEINSDAASEIVNSELIHMESVTMSEILNADSINVPASELPIEDRIFEVIDNIASVIVEKTNTYVAGKILDRDSDVDSKIYTFSELNGIEEGDVLMDYITAFPAKRRYSYPQPQKGVFSSEGLMLEKKNIMEIVHPFEAITFSSSIQDRGRRYDATPLSYGDKEMYVWKISDSSDSTELINTPVLHVDGSSDAVVNIYDKIILVEVTSPTSYDYFCVGIDFDVTSKAIQKNGRTLETLSVDGKTLLFPREVASLKRKLMSQDYIDDWRSPNVMSGFASMRMSIGDLDLPINTIPENLFSGVKDNSNIHLSHSPLSIAYRNNDSFGMEATMFFDDTEPSVSSGVDLTKIENISSLDSLDPNAPEQVPGTTPGAYSMTLSFDVSKYEPRIVSNQLIDTLKTGKVKMKINIGVIDGLQDSGGDILAQGFSQEEIPDTAGVDPSLYIHPHEVLIDYMEAREYKHLTEDGDGFIHKIDLARIVAEQLNDASTGDSFNRFYNLVYSTYQTGDTFIDTVFDLKSSSMKAGDVLITNLQTKGVSFAYKHAGQNPASPVIRGYYGTSEIDFESGTRLIGTMPSPIPDSFIREEDVTTELMLENIELDSIQIAFFISKYSIEVYCKNIGAILSENRTVTTNTIK